MIDILAGFALGLFIGYLIFYVVVARYFRYKLEEAEEDVAMIQTENIACESRIAQLEKALGDLRLLNESKSWHDSNNDFFNIDDDDD